MVTGQGAGGGAGRRAGARSRGELLAALAVVLVLVAGAVAVLQLRPDGAGEVVGRDPGPAAAAAVTRSSTAGDDELVDVPTASPEPEGERRAAASRGESESAPLDDAAIAAQQAAERRRALRQQARLAQQFAREVANAPISVRIGSFNVLGSQHTAPGGMKSRKYPPVSTRTPAAVGVIADHGVDVLGTQELQADQYREFTARTGMVGFPGFELGEAETDNSILWDPDVYERVDAGSFAVTFVGRSRPQPWVRLRDRATGREFIVVNAHLSPGGGTRAAERYRGMDTLVAQVRAFRESTGLPVLMTGDMNDREPFFCRVVVPAAMSASNGGSGAGGCAPPPQPIAVDWVVGSGVSGWSSYRRDTSTVTRRISDHFFISAVATLS